MLVQLCTSEVGLIEFLELLEYVSVSNWNPLKLSERGLVQACSLLVQLYLPSSRTHFYT